MALAPAAERKARDFIQEGERRLNSFAWFNKQAKYEDAAEAFTNAATQYKIAKMWQEAGDTYFKAAETHEKAANAHEATQCYVNAAKSYRNVDTAAAFNSYDIAVHRYMEGNRFSQAAKLHKDIGELYESEMKVQDAMAAFQHAADCYDGCDSRTSANQMRLKVADLAASGDDYKRAIELYENVAQSSIDNQLTKWSVGGYLFKAALCQFAMDAETGDTTSTSNKLDQYKAMVATFASSRECLLLEQLLPLFMDRDLEAFTDAVFGYDQVSPLDNWKSAILLNIKKKMKTSAEKVDDDVDEVDWK